MITMIIVGGACALVGGFVGGLIISAPTEPTIKPISPDWGLLNEKQHLEYRLAVTEKENIRLREELPLSYDDPCLESLLPTLLYATYARCVC
jgi:hypothetical protein